MPLLTYSSGMSMRLGFSVAANTDPEVLLLDEVFAVGDKAFQHKCLEKLEQFKSQHKTMIFVGHSLEPPQGICRRAVWTEDAWVRADGAFAEILRMYTPEVH